VSHCGYSFVQLLITVPPVVEEQVTGPIENSVEMATTVSNVARELRVPDGRFGS
jgi:hypothetical protein